ncbi:MAG: virulence factor [Actinomycetota bacterium]
MSRRRRGGGPELVTIYWRDIPAQVNASSEAGKHQAMLSPRFQHAIDRAAGVAGLTDTDSYVQQWRRVAQPLAGDPSTAADDEVARLEAIYDRDRLEELVATGGDDTTDTETPPDEAPQHEALPIKDSP